MPGVIDIISRLRKGQSNNAISGETKTHKKTVRKARSLAAQFGWLDKNNALPSEVELHDIWNKNYKPAPDRIHPLNQWYDNFKRWVDEGYTYVVMHELIKDLYPCEISTVSRYVKREFPKKPKVVIRRQTIPGEIMEVDFGFLGYVFDFQTRKKKKAWIFSGRLVHSRKAYRQICYDQKQATFFQCHIHAFNYFGGIPQKVRPDNLKAAVIRNAWEDHMINKSYRSLAEYYGFLINSCLPYHPQHKGGVESDIKYVKRNFWPRFKEQELQKGHADPHAAEIRQALEKWSSETADQRELRGIDSRSPEEIFVQEEKTTLNNLPLLHWEPVSWEKRTVGDDWHIQFNQAYYSVPEKYIGRQVEVCANSYSVHIFIDFKEISAHERAIRKWQRKTKPQHAPANYEKYLETHQQGLLIKARAQGENIHNVAREIFKDRASDGLRAVRSLLGFVKKYSRDRVENACKRALKYHTPSYMSVKHILLKRLDKTDSEQQLQTIERQTTFKFARDNGFFNV